MRYNLLVILVFTIAYSSNAQQDVTLAIGDTLYFDTCSGTNYQYIDYYKKTRFETDTLDFDTINGADFYSKFFDAGDFDVNRLPCSFTGKYAIIKHMMNVITRENTQQSVIIAMIENGVSAVYLITEAFNEEVLYAPKQ